MTAQPLELAASESTPAKSAGPWKFWGTKLWGLAIIATMVVVGAGCTFAALRWLNPDPSLPLPQLQAVIFTNSLLLVTIFGTAIICALAVLLLAVRLSALSARDYLGLSLPQQRDLLIGVAALAALYAGFTTVEHLFAPNVEEGFIKTYRAALSTGSLPALAAAI